MSALQTAGTISSLFNLYEELAESFFPTYCHPDGIAEIDYEGFQYRHVRVLWNFGPTLSAYIMLSPMFHTIERAVIRHGAGSSYREFLVDITTLPVAYRESICDVVSKDAEGKV